MLVVAVHLVLWGPVFPAAAQPPPPPPPNPSDQQLRQSADQLTQRAARLGTLSTRAAELDARAAQVQAELDGLREVAFQQLLELEAARAAADDAQREVESTRTQTRAAAGAVDSVRERLDEFAVAMYQQSLDLGPLGLLAEAASPADLVGRAELVDLVAREQARAQEGLERARVDRVNAESMARAAAERAGERQAAAIEAKATADDAVAATEAAAAEQRRRLDELSGERALVEQELDALRLTDERLRDQRKQFVDYQRQREEQEEARRRAAAEAAAAAAAEQPAEAPQRRRDVDQAAARLGPEYECRQRTPRWGPVKPWVAMAGNLLRCRFGIRTVGGVGPRPNVSDHPSGLALDLMVTGPNGDALAECAIRNRERLSVKYVIYRQRINNGSGWRRMEDRGSPVANHMEHVHVSFRPTSPKDRGPVSC